jgi:hypothetical protein
MLTALAAIGALVFTGVSSLQANHELRNRSNEVAIARDEQETARQAQVTDRFTAAVEQLGHDAIDVRLGGIYALQRIMQDSPRDQPAVVSVLSAFVRTHGVRPKPKKGPVLSRSLLVPEDAQAAAQVLGARKPSLDGAAVVDWSGAYLRGVNLSEARLPNAVLEGADLTDADLYDSDFTDSDLTDCNLRNAFITNAELNGTQLGSANLSDASMNGANLFAARLSGANLRNTSISGAQMRSTRDLTIEQVLSAFVTSHTSLPPVISRDARVKRRIAQIEAEAQG